MFFNQLRPKLFFKDKPIIINLSLAICLILLNLSLLYFKITPSPEPVALRYTVYFGIDLIGPWHNVFYLPLLGLLLLVLNSALAYLLYLRDKILSYLLILTSTMSQCLLLLIGILIILLNT